MAFTVFISYAHRDTALRDELAKHLSSLRHQHLIEDWYDGDIIPGQEWEQAIFSHLDSAQIILLLISSDFLASSFCYSKEMQRALARHDAKEAVVIPILLRPVEWQYAPFARIQALPTGAQPVTTWPTPDAAFADITRGIRRAIEHLQKAAAIATPPQHGNVADRSSSSPRDTFWNVPPRNPFFTGRDDIFPQLRQLLTANQTATLTQPPAISGFGGIGKTQTAIEYAYRYQKDYQYVFWVRAETREELVTDFTAIARLLNLPQQDALDQELILQAVKHWLETHSGWLLILDNADDLSLIAPHVPHSNTGHLLLTTRAYVMGTLARRVELDTMTGDDGTLLLLRRAKLIAQDAPTAASEEDRVSAQRIVTGLGGLPLALDQAGAYIEETGRSLTSYLALYQQEAYKIKLLERRGGILPSHPLSVSTTVALALQKITPIHPVAKDLLYFCAFLAPKRFPNTCLRQEPQS